MTGIAQNGCNALFSGWSLRNIYLEYKKNNVMAKI